MKPASRATPGEQIGPILPSTPLLLMLLVLGLGIVLSLGTMAVPRQGQAAATAQSPVDPLPPDTGAAGLKQMLSRLQTTARLMQTTAHPDDEDGGMLTLESRGHGVRTLLMTLTRGEGGQNKVAAICSMCWVYCALLS